MHPEEHRRDSNVLLALEPLTSDSRITLEDWKPHFYEMNKDNRYTPIRFFGKDKLELCSLHLPTIDEIRIHHHGQPHIIVHIGNIDDLADVITFVIEEIRRANLSYTKLVKERAEIDARNAQEQQRQIEVLQDVDQLIRETTESQ